MADISLIKQTMGIKMKPEVNQNQGNNIFEELNSKNLRGIKMNHNNITSCSFRAWRFIFSENGFSVLSMVSSFWNIVLKSIGSVTGRQQKIIGMIWNIILKERLKRSVLYFAKSICTRF